MIEKSILSILDEIDHKYWKEGDLHKCYCLFHDDKKNPNMVIFPTNTWYCFRCNEGFTAIDLLMKIKGITKVEAGKIVYGSKYLKESLLESKKNNKISLFNIKLTISEFIRKKLSKHRDNTVKLESLIKEVQKIDNIEPTVQNLDQILNQINKIGV